MTANRSWAAILLVLACAALLLACRHWSARSRRPWAVRGAGAYLALLHLVAIGGLLSSVAFENGLASLALLTFPWSMSVFDTIRMQGFVTPGDLATNYLRYILCFGGLNAALVGGFLALVVPARGGLPPGTSRPAGRMQAWATASRSRRKPPRAAGPPPATAQPREALFDSPALPSPVAL